MGWDAFCANTPQIRKIRDSGTSFLRMLRGSSWAERTLYCTGRKGGAGVGVRRRTSDLGRQTSSTLRPQLQYAASTPQPVILSGVAASRCEAAAQSKDPYSNCAPLLLIQSRQRKIPSHGLVEGDRGPSTPQADSLRESVCCAQDDRMRSDAEVRRPTPLLARDRGLVFRTSTGAEVGDLFVLVEQRLRAAAEVCARWLNSSISFFTQPTLEISISPSLAIQKMVGTLVSP